MRVFLDRVLLRSCLGGLGVQKGKILCFQRCTPKFFPITFGELAQLEGLHPAFPWRDKVPNTPLELFSTTLQSPVV